MNTKPKYDVGDVITVSTFDWDYEANAWAFNKGRIHLVGQILDIEPNNYPLFYKVTVNNIPVPFYISELDIFECIYPDNIDKPPVNLIKKLRRELV